MTPRCPSGAWGAREGCSERRALAAGDYWAWASRLAAQRPLVLLLHSPSSSCDITLSPWCSSSFTSALARAHVGWRLLHSDPRERVEVEV